MIYQLPNGRVIEMSVEQYLELNDQEVSELIGLSPSYTMEISNPFFKKFNLSQKKVNEDDTHEVEPDLQDVCKEEKLNDKDFHVED